VTVSVSVCVFEDCQRERERGMRSSGMGTKKSYAGGVWSLFGRGGHVPCRGNFLTLEFSFCWWHCLTTLLIVLTKCRILRKSFG
jgi:hypothetical protein